jgi:hypothetical protein
MPAQTPEAAIAKSTATSAVISAIVDYPIFNAQISGNSSATAAVALGVRADLPLPPHRSKDIF